MSTNMHFNSIQATTQPTLYNYQQPSHHRHRRHHQQHLPPPLTTQPAPIHNASSYSNHRLNNTNTSSSNSNSNTYSTRSNQIATPISSNQQSSAYFLDRIDLENYTSQTLKQTVESILSKTKSKGNERNKSQMTIDFVLSCRSLAFFSLLLLLLLHRFKGKNILTR